MTDEAEVAVVGAGPAGSAAAITLARLGREVILIDQSEFPRDKPCGDAVWGGAVRSIQELGLGTLIDEATPVEGTRVVRRGDSRPVFVPSARTNGDPHPRCIPRLKLDDQLFKAAREGGARFVLGRVQETIERDGQVEAVVLRRTDGQFAEVRAKNFVAADGATSRMRRLCGVGAAQFGEVAFAARQYLRVENPAAPIFDIRIPLRFRSQFLPGYGWVFPVADDIVNVGVGYFRTPRRSREPEASLRTVLASFVSGLGSDAEAAFGDFEAVSSPIGAPVAIGFSARNARKGNVLFVGDAARMTDPLIGEGIASALRSGVEAAHGIDGSLKRGRSPDFGTRLLDSFPRLGQDTRIVLRAYAHLVADAGPSDGDISKTYAGHPLMEDVATMLARGSDDVPSISNTPAVRLAASQNESIAGALVEFNDRAIETLHTEFPFARELMHRQLRSGAGPTAAVTHLTAVTSCGRDADSTSIEGALVLELLAMTEHFLGYAVDNDTPSNSSFGNGLTTLIGDFVLSHGLKAVGALGPQETIQLARLARTVFEGAMADAADTWTLTRTADRYLAAAGDRVGSIHAHAAVLAARLAGRDDAEQALTEYGRNLGIAIKISNDVCELVGGDDATARRPGLNLQRGDYSLPVIYALAADPSLGPLLGEVAIHDSLDDALARIASSDAVERCVDRCDEYVTAAAAALETAKLSNTAALREIAQLASARCRQSLPGQPEATGVPMSL